MEDAMILKDGAQSWVLPSSSAVPTSPTRFGGHLAAQCFVFLRPGHDLGAT